MKRITQIVLALIILTPGIAFSRPVTAEDLAGAQWIWHPDAGVQKAEFRRAISFDQPVEEIDFYVTASESFELRVNERLIGSSSNVRSPREYRVTRPIARDNSVVEIKASGRDGKAGLLCNMIIRFRDGKSRMISTDSVWMCAPEKPEGSPSESDWVYAKTLGMYPCAPWGKIMREKWETVSGRLSENKKHQWHSTGPEDEPSKSEFRGEYLHQEYAQLYKGFVSLNPRTGLLESNGAILRPLFALYDQKKPDGKVCDIPDLDFDLLRKDLARMKEMRINVEVPLNWKDLLSADGSWKLVERQPKGHGLPSFKYVSDIYDYFLDCAQANGLYVSFEPSFADGLNPDVIPSGYEGVLPLYDELWDSVRNAYSEIARHFNRRSVIISMVIGRDLKMGDCLDEPVMAAFFRSHLDERYGSISNLRRAWGYGYNLSDRSEWEHGNIGGRSVLTPVYPFVKGTFDSASSFDDISLPMVDFRRSSDPPFSPLYDLPTNQENLPLDPAWVDYTQMRESLFTSRLNQLCDSLRSADGNHLLAYLGSSDSVPLWSSLAPADKGGLHFDVICTDLDASDSLSDSFTLGVNSCRAYAEMEGNGFKGIAGSVGSLSSAVGLIGKGAAFIEVGDWGKLNDDGGILQSLSFIQDAPFTMSRDAQVLILRSAAGAHSLTPGLDIWNSIRLGEALTKHHVPFDILPESDVTPGNFGPGTVNLEKYRFIFVPAQNQLIGSETWQMLSDWVSDPRYLGKRGLCMGLYQDRDEHFNPVTPSDIHPAFQKLFGVKDLTSRVKASGDVRLRYERFIGSESRGTEIPVSMLQGGELGVFTPDKNGPDSIVQMGESGPSVAIRNIVNGNPVYACGFYLGLWYGEADGGSRPSKGLSNLYMEMLRSAGVAPELEAPENVSVDVSNDSAYILVEECSGIATDCDVALRLPSASNFVGMETVRKDDGTLILRRLHLEPYGCLVLRRAAGVGFSGGKDVSAICRASSEDQLEYEISGKGKATVIFDLKPEKSYLVRQNGAVLTTAYPNMGGKFPLTLDLARPVKITIEKNKHR